MSSKRTTTTTPSLNGRAYAEKAKRIFNIWTNVLGQTSAGVLGIQGFNYLNEEIMARSANKWDMGHNRYFGLNHSQ